MNALKTTRIIAIGIALVLITGFNTFGQTTCEVLVYNISESYQGECKKGLAHGKGIARGTDVYEGRFRKGYPDGKGTYIWQNGDYYEGSWDKGFRDGGGDFYIKSNNKDSLITGIWKADKYIGPKPINPKVTKSVGVGRYNFKRMNTGNQVTIKIYQMGILNTEISEVLMNANYGYQSNIGHYFVFENIQVPFKCCVQYKTWNKFHTSQNNIIFEFEITQLGKWEVNIHT